RAAGTLPRVAGSMPSRVEVVLALMMVVAGSQGCAALGTLGVVPLRISEPPGRSGELRLLGPSVDRPLGGAALRLWARVENPNGFGLTLSQVTGDLHIEEAE